MNTETLSLTPEVCSGNSFFANYGEPVITKQTGIPFTCSEKDKDILITFKTTKEKIDKFAEKGWQFFHNVATIQVREELYVQALKNLLKKNDFYELTLQMHEGLISDEEYENELRLNSSRYFIEFQEKVTTGFLPQIVEIVKKIGRKFSTDQIAEMFSIKQECIEETAKRLIAED